MAALTLDGISDTACGQRSLEAFCYGGILVEVPVGYTSVMWVPR